MIQLSVEENHETKILWTAWPKQEEALRRKEFEILFGGARGPGKTAAGIAWLVMGNVDLAELGSEDPTDISYINNPNYRALVLRKNVEDMRDWIEKAKQIYKPLGATFNVRPPEFRWDNGATIILGHLDDANAYEKYQGQEFARILLEEATQIPTFELYWRVVASCRSPHKNLRRQVFLTANPGGRGHGWVRDRFVADREAMTTFVDPETDLTRVFIPGRVKDNPIYANDRQYLGQLMGLPPMIRRAWLEGDWDAIAGQFFEEFRLAPVEGEPENACHVVDGSRFTLAPWFYRWVGCDWGYSHNAAVYKACQLPNGQIHIYDELVLSRVTPEELGVEIARFLWADINAGTQKTFNLHLSHEAFSKKTEERTIADQISEGIEQILGSNSVYILPAGNDAKSDIFSRAELQNSASVQIQRCSPQRVAGWTYMRSLMRWEPLIDPKDTSFDASYALKLFEEDRAKWAAYCKLFEMKQEVLPKLQIHGNTCPQLVAALPLLRAQEPDKGDPEDADSKHFPGLDSIDAARYLLFAHKFQQTQEPFEQFYAKHIAKHASGPMETLSGNSKVWMARKAEADYKKLTEGVSKPIHFNRSASRAQRRASLDKGKY